MTPRNRYFIIFILLQFLLFNSCSKTIVHPKNLEFEGIKLLPNNTFHNVYTEFDVGGSVVNIGTYKYVEDTLVLELDKDEYIRRNLQLHEYSCELPQASIELINFNEQEKRNNLIMLWTQLKIKGINNESDTILIWETNVINRSTNFNSIQIEKTKLNNISALWLEAYKSNLGEIVQVPNFTDCLKINYLLTNLPGELIKEEKVQYGMDKFLVEKTGKNTYKINILERNISKKIKYVK